VNVTATNHNKETITSERTFSLQRFSNLPTTHFTASPLFGDAPLQVYFTNETNLNIDEEDVRYIWQFGDGTVSTEKHPIHIFEKEGVYPVTLQTYLTKTQQSVSYHVPISVIDRNSYHIPITNKTRTRPQVLIAGFDPILIDLLDTQITVFAIVRAGSSSLKTVRAIRKGDNFNLVMQHVATYANGDQRYEAIYNFPAGTMPVLTRADFFGDQTGQYQIQVTDQAGQFHSFPNLEVTQEEDENNAVDVLYIEPLKQAGIRRHLPQILGAGFDPALVDITDSEFLVKAIVRAGLNPIQTVVLEYNAGGLNLPMKLLETLPNGDNVYGIIYTYPQGSLEKTTFGELFGDKLDQFSIIVTDQKGKQHRFPELKVGNYPQK